MNDKGPNEQEPEETNHAREQLAQFAHDLITPLSSARTLAELLANPGNSPERLKKLAGLIEKMLDLATDVAQEALDEYKGYPEVSSMMGSAAVRDAIVAVSSSSRLPAEMFTQETLEDFEFTGPSKSVYRAIQNLVKNAANSIISSGADRPQTILITISQELLPSNNSGQPPAQMTGTTQILGAHKSFGVIRVEDTGVGITPDQLAKIWEPRYSSSRVKGYGIGLSVVRTVIVDRCCGSVEVESVPGKGASFTVRLPLTEPPGTTSL